MRRVASFKVQSHVPELKPYSHNHLDWQMLMLDILGSKKLAEGVTLNPDAFLMAAAVRELAEKPLLERRAAHGCQGSMMTMVFWFSMRIACV